MQLNFATVDVFTSTQFGGNPVAVVLNAEGLSTKQMQMIAAEFNLSETTFVFPAKDPAHTAEVRIFTPRAEMPFAGHPNVGTAFVLARVGESYGRTIAGTRLIFEEKAGLVPLDLIKDGAVVSGARLAAPQGLAVGEKIEPEIIAAACTLPVESIEIENHLPCIASCGAVFILAELRDRTFLAAASPRVDVFSQHIPMDCATGILLYTQVEEAAIDIQCRMFAPLHGIPEDPATGSANVALVGLLAQLRPEANLKLDLTIMQGVEMGRPSRLEARAVKKDGRVMQTLISGRCVHVTSGSLHLL